MTTNLAKDYKKLSDRFGSGVASSVIFKKSNLDNAVQTSLARWKKVLLLDEWDIRIEVNDKKLDADGQSFNDWDSSKKTSHIVISSKTPLNEVDGDVAHECMHLVLSNENREYDQLCDDLLNQDKIDKDTYSMLQERFNLRQNESIEHLLKIIRGAK